LQKYKENAKIVGTSPRTKRKITDEFHANKRKRIQGSPSKDCHVEPLVCSEAQIDDGSGGGEMSIVQQSRPSGAGDLQVQMSNLDIAIGAEEAQMSSYRQKLVSTVDALKDLEQSKLRAESEKKQFCARKRSQVCLIFRMYIYLY
jgi:hypothetical protein